MTDYPFEAALRDFVRKLEAAGMKPQLLHGSDGKLAFGCSLSGSSEAKVRQILDEHVPGVITQADDTHLFITIPDFKECWKEWKWVVPE